MERFLGDKEVPSWMQNWQKYQAGLAGERARWEREEAARDATEQAAIQGKSDYVAS